MTREEGKKIVDKVQVFRQSFLITQTVYQEWFRVLEPYDYYDVEKKLDDYFRDSDNFGKYPDVYYLTKYLKTEEEKKILSVPHVSCQICKKSVKYEDYQRHYDRCSSVDYVVEMSKRYLDKTFNKDKLMSADDNTFKKFYYSTCKDIYNKMPDGFPKHLLENVLLTYEGKKPNYNLEEVVKEMNTK